MRNLISITTFLLLFTTNSCAKSECIKMPLYWCVNECLQIHERITSEPLKDVGELSEVCRKAYEGKCYASKGDNYSIHDRDLKCTAAVVKENE